MFTCILGSLCSYLWCYSSFSVIHKHWHFCTTYDGNKLETIKSLISFKVLTFVILLWIVMDVTDFSIHHIFKFRGIQKCQHCQLCVLWENSNVTALYVLNTGHARSFGLDSLSSFYCYLYPVFVYLFVFFKNCLHKLTHNSRIVISVSLLVNFFVP